MTVQQGAFVIGKEIRDILWPPNCVLLSVKRTEGDGSGMLAGDVLHLRCQTYDEPETLLLLEALVGAQSVKKDENTRESEQDHGVTET